MCHPASSLWLRRFATLVIGSTLALPAWAGLFSDDEARKQVTELRTTVEALAKRVDDASRNQLSFANQMEELRADLARLTGQIEVLTNGLESAHKRQQDFYVDLDNRLRKLESSAPTLSVPGAGDATQVHSDPQAEMRDYEAALGLLRAGKVKEAQAAFEAFLAKHPQAALLPNATYWLGSCLFQQKQHIQAAETFGRIYATWPADAKAPDALLSQGNALIEAKDEKGAAKAFETLIEKYPTSPAVETARARLKVLSSKTPPARKK